MWKNIWFWQYLIWREEFVTRNTRKSEGFALSEDGGSVVSYAGCGGFWSILKIWKINCEGRCRFFQNLIAREFVLLPIYPFLILTIGYSFDTCHTSMKVNGVNGAKIDSHNSHMSAVAYTYTFHRPIPINSKIHLNSSHFITFLKNFDFLAKPC